MAGFARLSRYKAPVVALVLLGSISGFMAGQQLGHPPKASVPRASLQPERIVNVRRAAAPTTRQLSHVTLAVPMKATDAVPAQWHVGNSGEHHHDHHGHGHHDGNDG